MKSAALSNTLAINMDKAMKIMKSLAILALSLVMLSGCATTNYAERPAQMIPEDDAGLIYFFREKSFVGGGVSYAINENGVKLGALKNGTFFVIHATSGRHVYEAKTESGAFVQLDVEAGRTYYVKGGVKMGVLAGRPELVQVTEAEAAGKIEKLKYTSL